MMSVCALCQCHLNSDVTELTDATLMEILIFLKLPNLPASNFVCKLCLEKISYVAKLRVSLQNESFQINPISDGLKSSVIGKLLDKDSNDGKEKMKEGKSHVNFFAETQSETMGQKDHSSKSLPMTTRSASRCNRPLFSMATFGRYFTDKHKKLSSSKKSEAQKKTLSFECQECFELFKDKKGLKRHRILTHQNGNPEKCPYCDADFGKEDSPDEIQAHIKSFHSENVKDIKRIRKRSKKKETDLRAKIQCLLCSYQGIKSWNMQRHYRIIHKYNKSKADMVGTFDPDFPDGFLCPQCGEHFINQDIMIKHILKSHSKISGEQCFFCPNKYVDIQAHMKRSHFDVINSSSFKCKKCIPELSFSSYGELMTHLKTPHRRIPNAKTKMTGPENTDAVTIPKLGLKREISNKRAALDGIKKVRKNKHNPIHMAGICPYCEHKYLDLLGHLRHKHQKEKTKEKKVCDICQESFGSIRELATHRQLHPNFKMHSCKRCPATFDTVLKQRKHRKECPKFKKKLKSISSLQGPDQGAQPTNYPLLPYCNTAKNDGGKPENLEFEGRGTVPCHICSKKFTRKTLLRQHYMKAHFFDPKKRVDDCQKSNEVLYPPGDSTNLCTYCNLQFHDQHASILHYMTKHATISGQICPYCDNTWGWKKFNNLDEHVSKYHMLEMQSPVQTCITCKKNFGTYEELKCHRQCHEGGNKKITVLMTSDQGPLNLHHIVGSRPEVANLGGVKCQLCNAFKLRKDHLKTHYIKYHSYRPKFAIENFPGERKTGDLFEDGEYQHECSNCPEKFNNHHLHIKHLLKSHCSYSGSICPYCKGAFPQRFVDLQAHVTTSHLDMLTGYNVCNTCMVCSRSFSSYGEFRDHVQMHGDNYRQLRHTVGRKKLTVAVLSNSRVDGIDLNLKLKLEK